MLTVIAVTLGVLSATTSAYRLGYSRGRTVERQRTIQLPPAAEIARRIGSVRILIETRWREQ